ncbi:two-component sensor histidine kinase [Flavobacteriaceae bacterium AU392]|nr:two-component sensor histidine kinase [Flavobacteriaceae bacterium]RKM84206.1 two-component sensor histidine kinase [Flavobacteriaceae bacterium AU392]
MMRTIVYIFCFLFALGTAAQQQSFKQTLDSIQKLRAYTFDEDLSLEERLDYALKASELAHRTKVDTIILRNDFRVGALYYQSEDYNKIREWKHRNLKLARKVKDSLIIAYENGILGWTYHIEGIQVDSIYYYYRRALNIFKKIKETDHEVSVILNLSKIQKSQKNYIEAENSIIDAITLLQKFPKDDENIDALWDSYNALGLISKDLKYYDRALDYYNEALEVNKNQSDILYKYTNYLYTTINIAEAYKEKKEYHKAIHIYNELLEDTKMYHKDAITYATVLSNLAYIRFLNKESNHNNILSLFKRAYQISDSLNASYEIAASGNNLSEFYISLNQKDSALPYLERSYQLAKQINENEEVLRSLKLFSQATEGEAGKEYLYEYIKLNDSLIANERIARNKFALIQFETEEITEERDKVTKQKSLLFGTSVTLVVMLALVYLVFVQRSKNRKLLFEREQQKANESIYSLMLQQQSILEQGRTEERFRISEELHDGILSKLFGTRMGLGFLSKKISGDASVLKKHSDFINQMQEIETEIRDVSHALKNKLLDSTVDFVAIIKYYIKGLSELHLFDYKVYADSKIPWSTINDQIKVNLYRILQEGLQNTIKHAKASHIDVSFYMINKQLELVIKDNGVGFDVKKQAKGIGLKNIKSRTQNLNGTLDIISNPDNGTLITVRFPI